MTRSNQAHIVFQCREGGVNERLTLAIGTYKHFKAGKCILTGQTIIKDDECIELETAVNVIDGSDTILLSMEALDRIEQVRGQLRLQNQLENTAPTQQQYPHLFNNIIFNKNVDDINLDEVVSGERREYLA